jgi:hypothetical protein
MRFFKFWMFSESSSIDGARNASSLAHTSLTFILCDGSGDPLVDALDSLGLPVAANFGTLCSGAEEGLRV